MLDLQICIQSVNSLLGRWRTLILRVRGIAVYYNRSIYCYFHDSQYSKTRSCDLKPLFKIKMKKKNVIVVQADYYKHSRIERNPSKFSIDKFEDKISRYDNIIRLTLSINKFDCIVKFWNRVYKHGNSAFRLLPRLTVREKGQ